MGGGGGRNSAPQSFQSFPSALPFPALIPLSIFPYFSLQYECISISLSPFFPCCDTFVQISAISVSTYIHTFLVEPFSQHRLYIFEVSSNF